MTARSATVDRTVLQGMRILVVEDELLLAMEVRMLIERAGGVVVGPAPRVAEALALVERENVDGAILDVNLAGTMSFGVADALADRGTPFFFLTGYGGAQLPARFRARLALEKPVMGDEMLATISEVFATPAPAKDARED